MIFSIQSKENKSHHQIKHIQFNLSNKFHLKQIGGLQCLEQICPKRIFLIKNKKSKPYYRIQHIQIRLSTNFHLKETVLSFRSNLPQKVITGPN